jgi:hypothetical protein
MARLAGLFERHHVGSHAVVRTQQSTIAFTCVLGYR